MTKINEKKIVEIANRTVNSFRKLWENNPYRWDTEADIHGELYVMIKSALKRKGLFRGRYKKHMDREEYFNRVYCKPLTHIGEGEKYYPDIVIYEKCTFKNNDNINEPMLWVCEIKYKTQWGGDQSLENRKYDKTKLRKLLKQRNSKIKGAKNAYVLHFFRYKCRKKNDSAFERVNSK